MRTIWKYAITVTDHQDIPLPFGAEILRVGLDSDELPCLWALVDTSQPAAPVTLHVVGTDGTAPDHCTYLGSFNHRGQFVWHVFAKVRV